MHGAKKDNKAFKVKHRSRTKCRQESIVIHHKHWSHGRVKYAFLRKMKSAEPLPKELSHDSRLCVPKDLRPLLSFVAIFRSTDISGPRRANIPHRVIDYIRPKISAARRGRTKRAAARLRCRIQNLVVDLRCRIAKYLCTTFNLIILPTFPVQQMVTRRGGRWRISTKTARAMATWSHYKFQRRLLNKAQEYK
ncbi:hypothetical protein V1522DRAFT_409656 [Lipomyces starkeyi]